MTSFQKRVAILGTGWGTGVTAPALRAEGWEVRALFSRRLERAEQIASKLSIPHHTDDAHALLQRNDIDAVVISTPTSTHHEYVLEAIQAGKHVLCEKPFAADLTQGRAMIEAAQDSKLTAMCNFEFRYTDHRLLITRLVQDGLIGTVQSATATFYFSVPSSQPLDWRSQVAMGGGALNEHGSHYLDALRGWVGEPSAISAQLATHEPLRIDPETGKEAHSDVDDFVAATVQFASGAIANLCIVWSSRVSTRGELSLTGPGGTISHRSPAGLFGMGEVRHTASAPASAELRNVAAGYRIGEEDGAPSPRSEGAPLTLPRDIELLPGPENVAASRRLLRDFERGIEEGRSPAPNFEDGLRTQAMIDAARESAREGRVVALT